MIMSCLGSLSLLSYLHPSLDFQLGLQCAGYALSSVEGRVAMEFFDLSEAGQSKKYVLVCDICEHGVVYLPIVLVIFSYY